MYYVSLNGERLNVGSDKPPSSHQILLVDRSPTGELAFKYAQELRSCSVGSGMTLSKAAKLLKIHHCAVVSVVALLTVALWTFIGVVVYSAF